MGRRLTRYLLDSTVLMEWLRGRAALERFHDGLVPWLLGGWRTVLSGRRRRQEVPRRDHGIEGLRDVSPEQVGESGARRRDEGSGVAGKERLGPEEQLSRLEALLAEVEELSEDHRRLVMDLLDGVDALHRMALVRLGDQLGAHQLAELRADPVVAWLLDAYAVGVDERAAADAALEEVRPFLHSHGGEVEVLDAAGGVVRVRMSGACSGCTASAITRQEGVEEALREHFPGFSALEVEPSDAEAHPPPPGPTLVEFRSRR